MKYEHIYLSRICMPLQAALYYEKKLSGSALNKSARSFNRAN
jgi:hypothetical protein